MDLKKLTPGEIVIAVSGVLLLVFSFFSWYGVDGNELTEQFGIDTSFNGWQSPNAGLSIIAILIGVAMAAHVIIDRLTGVEMPERIGSVGWGIFYLAGGCVAFVFVLIKWLSNTDFTKFGLYVGLLCTIGLAVGGYLVAKERDQLTALRGSGGTTPPAPPSV